MMMHLKKFYIMEGDSTKNNQKNEEYTLYLCHCMYECLNLNFQDYKVSEYNSLRFYGKLLVNHFS